MVYIIFTQLQIYEEDFKREKREKESLQQQLRAKNNGVSHITSANIHFECSQLDTKYGNEHNFILLMQNHRNVAGDLSST